MENVNMNLNVKSEFRLDNVTGFEYAMQILKKAEEKNKAMKLHMSSCSDNKKTLVITCGFINSVTHNVINPEYDGFEIQLMDREHILHSSAERFYGSFESFQTDTTTYTGYEIRVQYKDKSYFIIEIPDMI